MAERDPEDLLDSISDGRPADWETAERGAGEAQRSRLSILRGLSRIAAFNLDLQREPEERRGPGRWGDLVLLERLGAGARGEVWRAWEPSLEREVALKLLHADHDDGVLLDEARNLARVRHPHVVNVLGVDRRDGRVGLWMELIRGGSLEQVVRAQGPLSPHEVRRIGVAIAAAIAAVHSAGLVHRDIKPANVVRDAQDRWVLTDFGLGLREGVRERERIGPAGTPMYMAPELLSGADPSERTDVYSLGMSLWFALAGRHPFDVPTFAELTVAAGHGPRPPLRDVRRGIPPALAEVVERAIAPDASRRFGSAREMLEALERVRLPRASSQREKWMAAIAAAALVVASLVVVRQTTRRPAPVSPPAPAAPAVTGYSVEASLLSRENGRITRLVSGDRVKPGQNLWLQIRVTRPAWVYVLDEDERGERYVLFPQPRLDVRNPIAADSSFVLPGTVGGREYGWTVTSAGGREHVLVIASPEPIAEIEADLGRLPRAEPDAPLTYAPMGSAAVERLRGIGSMAPGAPAARSSPASPVFDRFRALAGRETGVQGVWIRHVVLENPGR